MTNIERIRTSDDKELANFLCEMFDIKAGCDFCIASKYCKRGRNGFHEWLQKESK